MSADDAAAIAAIYNHHVLNTVVTFEEVPVDAAAMRARIEEIERAHVWYVAEVAGELAGYAYASAWRPRTAYRKSVETTVYLGDAYLRRGIGAALYETLLPELARRGFHSAMAGIALPNAGSVALHERVGFAKVAHFREVGWKLDRWIDVAYWQRML
ncbi:MAG: arsinothricin resistance N-acetyltransferase ArsN1 family B [Burkholderiales bacterium]